MKTVSLNLYSFPELSEKAKAKALAKWNENDDMPFLADYLEDRLTGFLAENRIEDKEKSAKLYYSLSNSQGDGVCFIGSFEWKKNLITITHSGRYYHSNSKIITIKTGK